MGGQFPVHTSCSNRSLRRRQAAGRLAASSQTPTDLGSCYLFQQDFQQNYLAWLGFWRLAESRARTNQRGKLLFWTAVHWLTIRSLFCCFYWLLALSVRAVVRALPHSLSVKALVVWESGVGAAVYWSPGEASDPLLLAHVPESDADW